MLIEKVSDEIQIVTIECLAYEIWNEYFTPIIGKAQVDYMLEKFQSKKVITEQIFGVRAKTNYHIQDLRQENKRVR